MALTKDQKASIVSETSQLLKQSKMTVIAQYKGINVKSLQLLRKNAQVNGTVVRVIKNRLFIQALKSSDTLNTIKTSPFKEQLIYAFNDHDELSAAQTLANFAKTAPSLQLVGAIMNDGRYINAEDVKVLANLPSIAQLRSQLISTIAAPLSGFNNVLNANLRSVVNILNARMASI